MKISKTQLNSVWPTKTLWRCSKSRLRNNTYLVIFDCTKKKESNDLDGDPGKKRLGFDRSNRCRQWIHCVDAFDRRRKRRRSSSSPKSFPTTTASANRPPSEAPPLFFVSLTAKFHNALVYHEPCFFSKIIFQFCVSLKKITRLELGGGSFFRLFYIRPELVGKHFQNVLRSHTIKR